MSIKNASGQVSIQKQAGENVVITITNPDGSQAAPVTVQTDDKGNYTAQVTLDPGTGYQAQAHIDEDAEYQAAQSQVVTFDVSKEARTITFTIA